MKTAFERLCNQDHGEDQKKEKEKQKRKKIVA